MIRRLPSILRLETTFERKNEVDRNRYQQLKYDLVQNERAHKADGKVYRAYTLGKNDLIQEVLRKTGFDGFRFVIATHTKEWEAVKHFRNQYFFQPEKMEDPFTWTFNHRLHRHLILYRGVEIVGYAHVQLWPKERANLRIIVIEKSERGKGYGKILMNYIEKWLRLEGIKQLCIDSSKDALGFYEHLNYIPMAFEDPDGYDRDRNDIAVGKNL